jgi:2,4-dienoyl-CoA reductase (NADPH2)
MPVAAVVKDLETRELTDLSTYFATQLRKEKVVVHMKREVTPEIVRAERPDVLIIATGAAHMPFELPGSDSSTYIPTERLHGQIKLALRFFSPLRLQRLTKLWMPVGKSVVIMGGKLHGCELGEFLVKRGRQVVIAHDGPAAEFGEDMTIDDQENLWPWFKQKHVTMWSDLEYLKIVENGLRVRTTDKRIFTLRGKNVMTTQDWGPDTATAERLGSLAPETYVIGSAREPGLVVDAIRDGALTGYSV